MRRIKIISDGRGSGTKVVDADSGEDLRLPITAINWSVAVSGLAEVSAEVEGNPEAQIDMEMISLDVVGKLRNKDAIRRWIEAARSIIE